MKFFMINRFPHEPFNTYVRQGIGGAKIKEVLDAVKPEFVNFTEIDGVRACICVVDIKDYSQLPAKSEPFFLTFEADVQFHVCMSPEDLAKSDLDNMAD